MDQLVIARVPIKSLVPDPANPRRHDERNLAAIRSSLQRFNQAEPIVTQAGTRRIIAGHGRLEAMQSLGWTECDIVELAVDDLTATALGVAMNRTGELASWDDDALGPILQALANAGALDATGFTSEELDELIASMQKPGPVEDPGPVEPPEVATTQRGDMCLLDRHRLMCGDSTSGEDFAVLMSGERALLWPSDPPYCVNYTGNDRPIHDGRASGKDWTHVYREVDIADLGQFLDGVFAATLPHLEEHSAIYCWHEQAQPQRDRSRLVRTLR